MRAWAGQGLEKGPWTGQWGVSLTPIGEDPKQW